ncbi:MAG TPA: hypothetical protein VJ111_16020, partial [Chitinophagaceae bacterium]|nr:hypothetical protein [Chitinophagaceae bacterium]
EAILAIRNQALAKYYLAKANSSIKFFVTALKGSAVRTVLNLMTLSFGIISKPERVILFLKQHTLLKIILIDIVQ